MAGKLGGLLITVAGDVAKLRADMDRGVSLVEGAMGQINRAVGTAKAAFAGLGVGLSVAGIASFVKGGIDAADALNLLSSKTGIAVEDLSKYAYAARQADVDQGALAAGLQRFATLLSKAEQGTASAQDTLKRLGVTRFDNFNAAIEQAADGIQKLGKSRQAVALLREAFGKGGAGFAQLFENGAAGLRAFGDEAERTGNVVSGDTARAADSFNDSMTRLQQTVEGAQIQLGARMLPSLERIVQAFRDGYEQGGLFDATIDGLRETFSQAFGDPTLNLIEKTEDQIAELRAEAARLKGNDFAAKVNKFFAGDGEVEKAIAAINKQIGELETRLKGLKSIAADNAAADRAPTGAPTPAPLGADTDPAAERKAQEEAAKLAEARQKKIDEVIRALEFENAQFNRTADAQKVYQELQKAGVDLTSKEGQQIAELTAKRTINEKSLKAEAETRQWLAEIEAEDLQRRDRAIDLTKSLQTPQETLNASIREYLSLLEDGVITQDTYARAVNKAVDDMEAAVKKQDGLDDRTKQLQQGAKDLGLTFTSAFEDAIVGAESAGDVIKGLGSDIARIITRMLIIQPLINALSSSLGGLFNGAGGGGGGGGLMDLFSGGGALAGFATGGSFKVGGSGGIDSQLVAFKATPGEEVKIGPAGFAGGGTSVNLTVVANDARGFDDLLARRKAMIVGMVQQAFEKNTKRGMR